jgi:superfamily II RNA helicase
MVVITEDTFPENLNIKYNEYFNKFPFELSVFQKWSIKAIVDGNHTLVTAHTGSGKTLPAEFAINHFVSMGKKVIYTSPIKALSNQKLYDLRNKYPEISFGILTGDIKDNPEADVLIMTTEILRNTLFSKKIINNESNNSNINIVNNTLDFDIDFNNELGAVIFDEVHYIDDEERGSVWEQSLLLLPPQVQLVLLSATISNANQFATWLEEEKQKQTYKEDIKKELYLSSTNHRVVPLIHYGWLNLNNNYIKNIKDKKQLEFVNEMINKPILLKNDKNIYNDKNHDKIKKFLHYTNINNIRIARKSVMNNLLYYLKNNNMLPALCFIFSRNQVEKCADEITTNLFDEDSSKVPAIIKQECMKMLIKKIPNYKEYTCLPEFNKIIKYLEKGIGIHHAGLTPIFREMVELCFERGYIKLLIATETFAVGLNMPTKTVIFTGLQKFNGNVVRDLYGYEYTQMSGRAGRRGLDKIGYVFHCNNLFELPDNNTYYNILVNNVKNIKSRFRISFSLILNICSSLETEETNNHSKLINFIEQSMMNGDIQKEIKYANDEICKINEMLDKYENIKEKNKVPHNILINYKSKKENINNYKNKQKKKLLVELNNIENDYNTNDLNDGLDVLSKINEFKEQIKNQEDFKYYATNYIKSNVYAIICLFEKRSYINDVSFLLTQKGVIASNIQEVHCLIMGDLYEQTNGFSEFSVDDLIGLYSIFTNINVKDEYKVINYNGTSNVLNKYIKSTTELFELYQKLECDFKINTGSDYTHNLDIIDYTIEWANSTNENECINLINNITNEKGIFLGDFIKALLKINNINNEMIKVCNILNNLELLEKINEIEYKILKFIATNQSLYV